MIRKLLLALTCLFFLAVPAARATVYYVDGSKPNNSLDGKSWANAKRDVQAAINATTLNGDQVWVKAGTYLPTLNPNGGPSSGVVAQDNAFYVAVFDIKLYGGFPNTASPVFSDRNPVANVTILSGDLDGPGGTADAYHVLVTDGRTAACVVDGFTITGGRANNTGSTFFYYNGNINNGGSFYQYQGGGVYNNGSSPTISNCVITSNYALYDGGGMNNAYCTPALNNCTFSNNNSDLGGAISIVGTISSQSSGIQMTVSGCVFSNNTGSAIDITTTNLTISNCSFTNNSGGTGVISGAGGCVRNYYGNLTVKNSTFSNNTVTGPSSSGGAIDNRSQYGHNSFVAISNCTFSTNSAANAGGAIYLGYNTFSTIDSSTFTGNTAGNLGGAVFANAIASYNGYVGPYNGSCATSNCTFSGNSASSGGGFYFTGFDNYFGFVKVSNSSFNGNSATQNGGGLAGTSGDTLTVDNCTFSGNTAGNNGGGLFSEIGSPTIKSCTFTANSAGQSGGGLFELNSARITNCILSGNTAGIATDMDIRSAPEPVTYSLIAPGNTRYYVGVGVTTGAPAFVNAASPAGPDGLFRTADDGLRIGCTSGARNSGTATTPATDIVGNPWVGVPDMGAYEHPGTGCTNLIQYVDASMPANGNGYSWGSAKRDLQAAIDSVAAGGEVWVKAGTYLPTLDPSGNATPADVRDKTFYITSKDVKIYGGFVGTETLLSQRNAATNLTTLSGNLDGAGGTNDAYHVLLTKGRTAASVVDGFTITGGRANGGGTISIAGTLFSQSDGGGVTNNGSSLTFNNCIIANNSADAYAGGMCNMASAPIIRGCVFSNNAGDKGGAMVNISSSSPAISSSTFSANSAGTFGGGIYYANNSGGSITNTILSGNAGGSLNYQNILKDGSLVGLAVSNSVIGDYSPTAVNNYTATNVLSGDPFVEAGNPAGADGRLGTADDGLRINCSSQARDAGTGTTPATDILGNSRVGTIDIGAYEFQGTTCPTLIYVNGSRPDNSGTGTSWSTAKRDVQAAINEVAAGGEVWVRAGTYLPTLDPNGSATPADTRDKTFYLTTKDIKIYGGFAGTETQLSARNPVTNVTLLSGDLDGASGTNDAYHVLITGGRTIACTVDGFTITGGRANGSGTLSASGNAFSRTKAGGMYNLNGNPTIGSCIFSASSAGNNGGGMYNEGGNPIVSRCTFTSNTAAAGGGMYNTTASPVMTGCTFSNNTASQNGGGLFNDNSSTQIDSCTFNTNTATISGGGLYNKDGNPSVSRCLIRNNTAVSNGGGIVNDNSNPAISTCIFSGNTSGSNGGGISNMSSSPVLSSSTFSANTASINGGGYYGDNNSGGTITNTILSANMGGSINRQNIYKDAGSGVLTVSYSVIGDYSPTATNNYTASNILTGDPFVAANNPAGADGKLGTGDDGLRLGCSSVARDAGTGTTPVTDILGSPRVGAIDIGAYEYQGTNCPAQLYVNGSRPDNSGTGTSWATAKKDVQAAINEVAAGGVVWVKSGTYLPTLDPNGNATPADVRDKTFYLLSKDVKLYGGFAGTETQLSARNPVTNMTTLSGGLDSNAGTADAYHVLITSGRTTACVINGFTITGGRADGSGTLLASGTAFDRTKAGGMYNSNSSPTIGSCIFGSNTAASDGGGMYNKGGNPVITSCTYSNNSAGAGGAMYDSLANPVINDCSFANNTATQNGGGLYNYSSSPQLNNCTFNNNTATTSGGGFYNINSSSAVTGCTFSANAAMVYGGGMYNEGGNPAISNCTFSSNIANTNGGGLYNLNSNPIINSCTFSSNTASASGGGLYTLNGNPSISSATFSANTASVYGGGIYNEGGNPVVSNCAFTSNAATQSGGGMYNAAASPVMTNCIFSSNTAGNNGGGLFNESSSPAISSNTFNANTAAQNGGGIYSDNNSGGSITNTILSGNTGGPAARQNIYKDGSTGVLTVSYSVIPDYSGTATNNYIASNILTGDPLFVNAALAAGSDGIFRTADDGLRITNCASPARNAGIGTTPATDILGNARVGTIDIGAYENTNPSCPKTLYVDAGRATNNDNGLSWATAKKDLQEAINAALAGDEIWVKAGTYLPTLDPNSSVPSNLRDKTFYLTSKDVKLYGGFAGTETLLFQRNVVTNATILSGDLDGTNGTKDAYHVLITGGRTSACVIDGFTITGGRADSTSTIVFSGITYARNFGGGMYHSGGSPKISNCIIRNNSASDNGGGMSNATASPQISNCTFSTNTAGTRGGGVHNNGGSPSVISCAFNNNTSVLNGGGIANIGISTVSVSRCTFNANSSGQYGGGLSNGSSSNLSINNCIFSANTATTGGGGLANVANGILAISNSTFTGNTAITSGVGGGLFNSNNGRGSVTNCILSGNMGGPLYRQNIYKDTGTTILTVSYTLINDYSSTATNNYTASNILRDDPLFVNAANPAGADGKLGTADDGLALRSCSPAINAGTTPTPVAAQDILNNNRLGAYDLGAYEYQSAAASQVLAGATTTAIGTEYLGGVLSLGDCNNAIATLRSQGNKPVSGTVTAKVYVQSATPMQGPTPYVRRHYDITPVAGADTATAQVTLYFTQADFNDYNNARGSLPPLPMNATDAGNKANVRVLQEHGSSVTSLPGSYSGWGGAGPATISFTPDSVVWNAMASRWEVTFPVTGFSGFFLQSGAATALPVKLLAFGAKPIHATLNQVAWATAHEESGTLFTVERSADARTFKSIGTVAGRSIFAGSEYRHDDVAPLVGNNYYRLKSREPTGEESYSQTVLVKSGDVQGAVVAVFPNPAYDWVTIRCMKAELLGSRAVLVDMTGRLVKELVLEKETLLDIHQLSAGGYVLRLADGNTVRIVRK